MKKSDLMRIKENIKHRVKGEVMVRCFDDGRVHVVIMPIDMKFIWGKVFATQDIDNLTPTQVGRLVKDSFEKFVISHYFNC